MAEAPRLNRLQLDGFQNLPANVGPAFDTLFNLLNPFLGDMSRAMNKRLTNGQNLATVVKTVEFTMPDDTVNLTLSAPWVQYDSTGLTQHAPAYRKTFDGKVELFGQAKNGNYSTVLATLPATCAPATEKWFIVQSENRPQGVKVKPDGTINVGSLVVHETNQAGTLVDTAQGVSPATDLSLDGIVFTAKDRTLLTLPTPFPLLVNCSELPGTASGMTVLKCEDITNTQIVPALAPVIAWSPASTNSTASQTLSVTSVYGCSPGRKYRLYLLISV